MVDYGLNDKVVLVTGTNNPQGIGAAIACAFAEQGAKVALVYKKMDLPYDEKKQLGIHLTLIIKHWRVTVLR